MTSLRGGVKLTPMKKLSTYLFLILFSFSVPSFADDIQDIQIEGMSVGDSLLDYLTKKKIKKLEILYYPKSKKYLRLYDVKKSKKLLEYERVDVHVKENDKNYIIVSINGLFFYKNNIQECYQKKKEIVKDISSAVSSKKNSYIYNYPDDNSKSDVTDFGLPDGSIRIWCTDYSKEREKEEKNKWTDHLSVTASSAEFLKWLNTESR